MQSNPAGLDITAYRLAIARAMQTDGFVDYHSAYDYSRRILQVTESIAALLNRGHAPAVIELTEYALAQLETAIGHMDDSDGYMNDILPELQNLHHHACLEARPNPRALARRLFAWETMSDWEIFYGTAETYADVFGAEGLAEYRRLAEAEWAKIPQLNPGDKCQTASIERCRRCIRTYFFEANLVTSYRNDQLIEPFGTKNGTNAKRLPNAVASSFVSLTFLAPQVGARGHSRMPRDLQILRFS